MIKITQKFKLTLFGLISAFFTVGAILFPKNALSADGATGLYHDKQIIPEVMAIYCETNAEDMLNKPSLLDECLLKYLISINNDNAEIRTEGIKDYKDLKLRTMLDLVATATTKLSNIVNYEEQENDAAEKSRGTQTEAQDGAAVRNNLAVSTHIVNSLRELYVASIFMQGIQSLEHVDPSILGDATSSEEDKN